MIMDRYISIVTRIIRMPVVVAGDRKEKKKVIIKAQTIKSNHGNNTPI